MRCRVLVLLPFALSVSLSASPVAAVRHSVVPAVAAHQPLPGDDGRVGYVAGDAGGTGVYSYHPGEAQPQTVLEPSAGLGGIFSGVRQVKSLSATGGCGVFWGSCVDALSGVRALNYFRRTAAGDGPVKSSGQGPDTSLWLLPSADGRLVLRYGNGDQDSAVALCRVDGDGNFSSEQPIGENWLPGAKLDMQPAFSGNGRYLFFVAEADGVLSLKRLDLSDGAVAMIAPMGDLDKLQVAGIPLVACSGDGRVVAFPSHDWPNGAMKLAQLNARGGYDVRDIVSSSSAVVYGSPSLSGDGRHLAYVAGSKDGARLLGRAFRHDLMTGETIEASPQSGEASYCAAGISPGGRFMGMAGDDGALWTADFGGGIIVDNPRVVVDVGQERATIALRLSLLDSELADAVISFECDEWSEGDAMADGQDGEARLPGEGYAAGSAAINWVFTPGEKRGVRNFVFTLADGSGRKSIARVAVIVRGEVRNLTAAAVGTDGDADKYGYSDFGFNADASMALLRTNAPLDAGGSPGNAYGLYLWSRSDGLFRRVDTAIGGAGGVYGGRLSGDGKTVLWFDGDGNLHRSGGKRAILEGASRRRGAVISHDGQVIAAVKDGEVMASIDGGESFASIGAVSAGDGNALSLSMDGLTLGYLDDGGRVVAYHPRDGSAQIIGTGQARLWGMSHGGGRFLMLDANGRLWLYCIDGGKSLTLAEGCLVTEAAAISGNGRFVYRSVGGKLHSRRVKGNELSGDWQEMPLGGNGEFAVSSSGKHLLAVSKDASLDPCVDAPDGIDSLFLAERADFGNSPPRWDVASSGYELPEDSSLEVSCDRDSADGDEVVVLLKEPPAHGAATVIPPSRDGRYIHALRYVPDPDFCGGDSCVVELWDGASLVEATVNFTVKNVNDAPQWVEPECTSQLVVNAGGQAAGRILAIDPDTGNPPQWRDTLAYGVAPGAPLAVEVDADSGEVRVLPELAVLPGDYAITLTCTDICADGQVGEPITRDMTVTVVAPAPQDLTLAELLDAGGMAAGGSTDGTAAAKWRARLRGCWAHLSQMRPGGYALLSLPGAANAGAIRAALGGSSLWGFEQGAFRIVGDDAQLPAGTGFWVRIWPGQLQADAVIAVTPAAFREAPIPAHGALAGPLLDEAAPADRRRHRLQGGVWSDCTDTDGNAGWEAGRAVFVSPL